MYGSTDIQNVFEKTNMNFGVRSSRNCVVGTTIQASFKRTFQKMRAEASKRKLFLTVRQNLD